MIPCEALRRLLPAYVDGELVGEDLTSFESHVERCEDCRRALESERALAAMVAKTVPRAKASTELQARVEALMRKPRWTHRRVWLAVAAASAVLISTGFLLWNRPAQEEKSSAASEFVSLAADTHLRYVRRQIPLEVDSDRPEVITEWFEGRVPFHLTLPDYPVLEGESKPYELIGARLVSFQGDYAAYVAYRMEARPISLLVTSLTQVAPAGGEVIPFGSLTFHQKAVSGLKVITWTDKGLTYALVSDLAVDGEQSCLVCHGALKERRRIEGFSREKI